MKARCDYLDPTVAGVRCVLLAEHHGRHQSGDGIAMGQPGHLRDPPKALDAIVDTVLAYQPKARSKPAIQRKRRATKIAKEK